MACILSLWLVWLIFPLAIVSPRDPPGLAKHYLSLQGGLSSCEGFTDSMLDASQLVVERRGKTQLALVGDVTVLQDLDNLTYQVDIFKDVNSNWEYLTTLEEEDLCGHLMDKDQLWTPFVEEMEISGCPILKKTYKINESTLDVAKFPLDAKHDGHYRGQAILLQGDKKIACHFVDFDVSS